MNDEQKQHVETINSLDTELSFFYHISPQDLIVDIAYQRTLYSVKKRPDRLVCAAKNDIERLMACLLYMFIIRILSTRNYWSSSLAVPQVANLMPVNQLEELKSFCILVTILMPLPVT